MATRSLPRRSVKSPVVATRTKSKGSAPVRKARATATKAAGSTAGTARKAAAPKAVKKLVRDSFTMPQQDFDLIAALKQRLVSLKRPTKKSELLRAGLQLLTRQSDDVLLSAVNALIILKPGRPKKHG